jgi:crotonobetainyl-CoA:carnitine CoA-transferase CaiB-like acyl-CoA transferase
MSNHLGEQAVVVSGSITGLITGRVLSDFFDSVTILERDSLQLTQIEDGSTVPLPGPVVKFSRTPTRVRTGAPALGQHNHEILAEIGVDAISRLRSKNAKPS